MARTTKGWTIEPAGLTDLLLRVRQDYGDIPLYITENGAALSPLRIPTGSVRDPERIDYLERTISPRCMLRSQRAWSLRGYFVWSLMDNFEWADGSPPALRSGVRRFPHQGPHPETERLLYRRWIAANAVDPVLAEVNGGDANVPAYGAQADPL